MNREYVAISYEEGDMSFIIKYYWADRILMYEIERPNCTEIWTARSKLDTELFQDKSSGYTSLITPLEMSKFLMMRELMR